MIDPMTSFENFLEEKYPDKYMTCWGVGEVEAQGHSQKFPMICPACKGTGKKTEESRRWTEPIFEENGGLMK